MNFDQLPGSRMTFRQLSSTFGVAGRPYVKFRDLFMWPGDLLPTSSKFPCRWETFGKLPSTLRVARRLSIKFHCSQDTIRPLLSIFHVARRPSIVFCQLFLRPGDIP